MFRPSRRKPQILPEEVCLDILKNTDTGVLSLLGDGGYPYGVPINYVYHEGALYFHCGRFGHKIDAIEKEEKASFTIVSEDRVNSAAFATDYRSLILFGRVKKVEDPLEKRRSIEALCAKYSPMESPERTKQEIEGGFQALLMLRFTIEHLSGKEGKALARQRREAGETAEDQG